MAELAKQVLVGPETSGCKNAISGRLHYLQRSKCAVQCEAASSERENLFSLFMQLIIFGDTAARGSNFRRRRGLSGYRSTSVRAVLIGGIETRVGQEKDF